ncbi:inactivation-no-after-potential D protein-like [Uloborus diversus]|uniref:inactivation-no-after-potential D protein-like n=1 Tax=Uloborus diversus TaxID=327109 RepID=UPI002409E141|nr:inactivation-no-after-potential D protein-like [Uloborus diversus]
MEEIKRRNFNHRSQTKSDEEEDEYFDVSDSEPPDLPPNPPPTLVSDLTKVHVPQIVSSTLTEVTSHPKLAPTRLLPFEHKSLTVETKISPIAIPMRPTSMSPKSSTTTSATAPKVFDVGSLVSKVKPTVPFKPIRTSLSPKDAFPARTKPRTTSTLESLMGSDLSRQWGSERTVELLRDPSKGLGISIISGKVDHSVRAGIFVKNVLPDSPAGWNGTLKRGDRILEVSGVDLRSATHAQAVDVIKNASNPVTFVIQSLVPLPKNSEEVESLVVSSTSTPTTEETKEIDKSLDNVVISESKVTLLHSPDIASASSSNSSSRETTIKRSPSSSKDDVPTSSVVKKSASNVVTPDVPSVTKPAREEAEDVLAAPLAKGKALTTKGVQIDSTSAGNVKLTPAEREACVEEEDEFGYTNSKILHLLSKV